LLDKDVNPSVRVASPQCGNCGRRQNGVAEQVNAHYQNAADSGIAWV
jgi:hypothetical protein